MARRTQKRKADEQQSPLNTEPPAKKTKTLSELELEAWENWVYPPQFWDNLPELNLTRKAVQELNRRSKLQPRKKRQHHVTTPLPFKSLAQFARHGGPDLCDIRGYRPRPVKMSLNSSRPSRPSDATGTVSTVPTSVTGETKKSKKSTPYNRDFEIHLEEHGVHAMHFSKRPDLKEVRDVLRTRRASLSPSRFTEEAFDTFAVANSRAKDEDDIIASVIPTILGSENPGQASARNTVFGNLAPLTDGSICLAKPDHYDGAHPHELKRSVRAKLGKYIVPSTMQDKPLTPNFFLEAKGPDGSSAVAMRQGRYDGAIGCRAMHALQNYGEAEPTYDGKPHSFSSIYHNGQLQLFAHHVTAPLAQKGRPEYHVTQIKSYALNSDHESFIEGATAFRNVRDLAKRYRDDFIKAANTREYELAMLVSDDILPSVEEVDPVTHPSGDPRDDDDADRRGSQDDRGSPPILQPPVNDGNSQNSNNGPGVHAEEPPTAVSPPAVSNKRHRPPDSPRCTSGDTRPPQVRKRFTNDRVSEKGSLPGAMGPPAAMATPAADAVENGAI